VLVDEEEQEILRDCLSFFAKGIKSLSASGLASQMLQLRMLLNILESQ